VLRLVYLAEPEDFDYDVNTGVYVYVRDINLRLIDDRSTWFDTDGRETDRFEEDCVRRFPDPHAYRQIVYIEYGGTRVETLYHALVDGGRYIIPYPKSSDNLVISKFQYKVGQILNYPMPSFGSFDFGLHLAGITIEE
jgi:hypothetical protein